MTRALHTLIEYLRQNIRGGDAALTDAQLLERWIGQRDPAAFELLLWRHGPMVLNTCRRLLSQREDVEDAFQATFLVLVRKAGSIRRGEALAAWLHRVACRIAGRAHAANARRASREKPFADEPAAPPIDAPGLRDLHAILDEEIESLPAHYRRALILCCLEGKSQEEAARLLGCPRGTVSSWLTRGRERLRQRLLRRGIVVSTTGLTAALTPDALASGGMIPLVGSLIRMAGAFAAGGAVPVGLMSARPLALAEGVLRMMFMTKMKLVTAVCLTVAVAVAGVGTWSHTTRAGEEPIVLSEKPLRETPVILNEKPPKETPVTLVEKSPKETFIVDQHALEKDDIAWGEAVHGLQAGIAFRRGDQETYEVGQSVTFIVYLRNVSDKKINLSHIEPLFDEWMPVIQDAEGRRLTVVPGPINLGDVPIVHRTVEAGQQITLGYPWFRIRRDGYRGEVVGPTCYAMPGRYKVGYSVFSLRLDDGKDIRLGTKQVELDIRRRDSAKGDGADKKTPPRPKPVIPAVSKADETPLFYSLSRSIQIPFNIDLKNQDKIKELILCMSTDLGQTWYQVGKKPATERFFLFPAPGDGTYWFLIQQVDKQGRLEPADPHRAKPAMRICVDTTPPEVALQAEGDKNTINLTWVAEDANLEDKSVRQIQFALHKDGPWSDPIISGPLPNTGHNNWNLAGLSLSDFYVRIQVRDKAGNDAYAVAYVKLKEEKPPQEPPQRSKSKSKEYEEAWRFIDRVWPHLELERLGGKVPEAQQAFQACKDAGDLVSIRKLFKWTEKHADRLAKKLAGLRPDLIIDDEKEAQQLKRVSEQIAKLGEDIQEYLKAHADGK